MEFKLRGIENVNQFNIVIFNLLSMVEKAGLVAVIFICLLANTTPKNVQIYAKKLLTLINILRLQC